MRAIVILVSLVFTAFAPAQPRIEGKVSQEDIRGITAAIRAVTQDRVLVIRKSSQPDSAGVQTASSPTVDCQYFVRRIAGTWKIVGESCWTHVMKQETATERWPRLARPSQLSESDFTAMKVALLKHTHDEIRTVKVIQNSPLTVRVHTASTHIVTEGDYTLQKIGDDWKVHVDSQIIH